MASKLTVTMTKEKTTPGTVRYGDGVQPHSKNIYLTKEEVATLGNPETITVTIEATK